MLGEDPERGVGQVVLGQPDGLGLGHADVDIIGIFEPVAPAARPAESQRMPP